MIYLHNLPQIREGLDYLTGNDPVFSRLDFNFDNFLWPYMGPGFGSLVRIVIGQQVSVKAAASLWTRFISTIDPVTPEAVLALDAEAMRGLGLSRQKAAYIQGLALAVKDAVFRPEALSDLPEEEIRAILTSLKGFGQWSVDMYLIFGLARPDIWAPGDLGIREGLKRYHGLEARPSPEEARTMGEVFKPYRTAVSLLFWRMP